MAFDVKEEDLNKKGINSDYINVFNDLTRALYGYAKFADTKPLQHYEERYDTEKHPFLITDNNHRRVRRINDLVTEINTLIARGDEDASKYRALAGRAIFWIRGEYHGAHPKDKLRYDFSEKP